MATSTRVKDAKKMGLLAGHAHSLRVFKEVSDDGAALRLVRLRNPWAHFEWTGAWAKGCERWAQNPMLAARLDVTTPGSFYMCYEDFQHIFSLVVFCDPTSA